MNPQEHVSLAPLTTFHIGGPARFFIEAHTEEDINAAFALARLHDLPLFMLGEGSNVLVPDAGIEGVVLKIAIRDIAFENDGDGTLLVAGAGALWDTAVDAAGARELFGIENLAGIPGTIGGAVVQNIGAYGAELAEVFKYADVIDGVTGLRRRITRNEAAFSYRASFFKEHRECVIMRIALRLAQKAVPNISYPDLVRAHASGESLATPAEIARSVRAIRAKKFPTVAEEGTAGSFFKNPVIPRELADSLAERFPGLPAFPHEDGRVKISLAWLLDKALSFNGYTIGRARLYENHPLIIVTRAGATAAEVDALARAVAEKVFNMTGIEIEREVETFGE